MACKKRSKSAAAESVGMKGQVQQLHMRRSWISQPDWGSQGLKERERE